MLEKLLKLGKHTLIYGIGSSLTAIGGFLLIPLYTHVMTTSEYGILELLGRTADILLLIIMVGVRQAFIRFYFDSDTHEWHQTVVATTAAFLIFSSIITICLFFPFKNVVAGLLFKDPLIGVFFTYVLLWIPVDLLFKVGMTHLQIQIKSKTYILINFIQFAAMMSSNIALVYYFRMGIRGVLITNLWVSSILGSAFLLYYVKWTKVKISFSLLKKLLKFGFPYLPTAFFGYIIHNGDRYFLTLYSSLDEVGIYALAFKIGMFGVLVIMEPFGRVWTPFLFDNYNKKDGPDLISKVFAIFTLIVVAAGLGVSIAAPIVIPIISGEAFHKASKLIPLICLAAVFYDMAMLADAGILISKKTGYKPFIFATAAIAGIILNYSLIPHFGAMGAAIAIPITFFVLFIVNYSVSNKFYVIRIEYGKMFLIFGGAVSVYFISNFILNLDPKNHMIQFFSVLAILLYPLILWFGGLLSAGEKKTIMQLVNKKTA